MVVDRLNTWRAGTEQAAMSDCALRALAHSILTNSARPPDIRQFATSVLAHLDEETRIGVELHEADRAVRRAKAAVSGPLPPLRGQVKLWNNLEAARASRALVVESAVALLLSRTAGSANPETPRQCHDVATGSADAPSDVPCVVQGGAGPFAAKAGSDPEEDDSLAILDAAKLQTAGWQPLPGFDPKPGESTDDWRTRTTAEMHRLDHERMLAQYPSPPKPKGGARCLIVGWRETAARKSTTVPIHTPDELSRVTGWNAEYCQRWWAMNVGLADTVTFDAVTREIEIEEQADESAGEES